MIIDPFLNNPKTLYYKKFIMSNLQNTEILEKLYEEEYEAIYLEIANESDVTESGKDWVTPTEEDREIMHKLAAERAKKRFEDLSQ